MRRYSTMIACLALVPWLLAALARAEDPPVSYEAQIRKWRADFDADVRTGGWLELIGREKLVEGTVTIGSATTCRVRLPPRLGIPKLGSVTRHGNEFRFNPVRGIAATVDGAPAHGPTTLSTKSGTGRVRAAGISLAVRDVGDDFYLFVTDPANPAVGEFRGTTWYPVDESYRVTATFIPYAKPEERQLPLTHVETRQSWQSTGDVSFMLGTRSVRLRTFADDDELFLLFQDTTNGRETYGGGRFLHAPLPKDGKTELDFNKSFNPYCSVNAFVMCPIPPPENQLDFPVTAGETYDGPDHPP